MPEYLFILPPQFIEYVPAGGLHSKPGSVSTRKIIPEARRRLPGIIDVDLYVNFFLEEKLSANRIPVCDF
jgi:hypothetical protein